MYEFYDPLFNQEVIATVVLVFVVAHDRGCWAGEYELSLNKSINCWKQIQHIRVWKRNPIRIAHNLCDERLGLIVGYG